MPDPTRTDDDGVGLMRNRTDWSLDWQYVWPISDYNVLSDTSLSEKQTGRVQLHSLGKEYRLKLKNNHMTLLCHLSISSNECFLVISGSYLCAFIILGHNFICCRKLKDIYLYIYIYIYI